MNNRLPETQLEDAEKRGWYLRDAVNADVTTAGTVRRRQGYSQVFNGSDCHSFWGRDHDAFYVDYDTLWHVTGTYDAPVKTMVRNDLSPGLPMGFNEINGEVLFSNGVTFGRMNRDGTFHDHGVPVPSSAPTLTELTGGSLPAGIYQVAVTNVTAEGEESGSTQPVSITVLGGALISIADLPTPPDYGKIRIYMTTCNGDVFFKVTEQFVNATLAVQLVPDGGARCMTMFKSRMPAGRILRWHNGRLLVASGNTLFYSEPYNLGLYDPLRNYVQFAEDITVVEPCQNGTYLCSEQTYWLSGDAESFEVQPVLPYGGTFGTGGSMSDRNMVYWYSPRGLVVADANGSAKNMQEDSVVTVSASAGAAMFREQDGLKQLVASLLNPGKSVAAASSFMDAEVIRKETIL